MPPRRDASAPTSPRVPSPSRAPSDRGRTAPRSLRRRSNPRRVRKCDERAGASLFHDPRRGSRGQEDSRRVTRKARGGGRPVPAERTQGSRFSGRRSFGNSRPLLRVLTGRIVSGRSIKFTRRPTGALVLRFRPRRIINQFAPDENPRWRVWIRFQPAGPRACRPVPPVAASPRPSEARPTASVTPAHPLVHPRSRSRARIDRR